MHQPYPARPKFIFANRVQLLQEWSNLPYRILSKSTSKPKSQKEHLTLARNINYSCERSDSARNEQKYQDFWL